MKISLLYVCFTEQKIRIRQRNKSDPTEATREALNIIENIEEPGKYMHLLQALEDAGTVFNGVFIRIFLPYMHR